MSDIGLVTTTINIPTVLRDLRAIDKDVFFFVAGDLKSPHDEIRALCRELGNAVYLSPQDQEQSGYATHNALPWNCIQRRGMATLEAIKSGADILYFWDDDNLPTSDQHFALFRHYLSGEHRLNVAESPSGWFNAGMFGSPQYWHRGFPYSQRKPGKQGTAKERDGVRVGVQTGLILGDPDINATERLDRRPRVGSYSVVGASPVAINPKTTWGPYNSQNTALRRELAPLMLLPPHWGRYDDILGSLIAQRVMMATDYHVLYGPPFAHQKRNEHDLMRDLEQELWGMRWTETFCDVLRDAPVRDDASVLDNLAAVVNHIDEAALPWMPAASVEFMWAWLSDVERVM